MTPGITTTNMTLSAHQREALDAVRHWWDTPPPRGNRVFRLFGAAGTGKTTLARAVVHELGLGDGYGHLFGAYTGKAVHVLRGKGCEPANTLHSMLYVPTRSKWIGPLATARAKLARDPADAALMAEVEELAKLAAQPGWTRNESSPLLDARLLICDEVSMVDEDMARDILAFPPRVLVLGDVEQLPPVSGKAGYFTGALADFTLTEVHRQAAQSPVLALATRVRNSTDHAFGLTPADYTTMNLRTAIEEYDQILCGKNATRWTLITAVRAMLERPAGIPVPGDRIICLKNNREIGVFNGQQFEVMDTGTSHREGEVRFDLLSDDGRTYPGMRAYAAGFAGEEGEKGLGFAGFKGPTGVFTFAQAITVHKSQGSEWDRVLIWDESRSFARADPGTGRTAQEMGRRWLYTAITRAAQSVSVFRP